MFEVYNTYSLRIIVKYGRIFTQPQRCGLSICSSDMGSEWSSTLAYMIRLAGKGFVLFILYVLALPQIMLQFFGPRLQVASLH